MTMTRTMTRKEMQQVIEISHKLIEAEKRIAELEHDFLFAKTGFPVTAHPKRTTEAPGEYIGGTGTFTCPPGSGITILADHGDGTHVKFERVDNAKD
jgi:hypothetical protein